MKKKIIIITGMSVGILVTGSILFFNREHFFFAKKTQDQMVANFSPTPKEELVVWDDPAGFSFQYPKGLNMDIHDEDTQHYAHIELTSPEHKGRLIVWAKDTTATTIDGWFKNEKSLQDAVSVDTVLGKNEAKKIIVKDGIVKQITATLDEDVLMMVETELDDEVFWQQINDIVVSTFAFTTNIKEDEDAAAGANEEPAAAADEEESIE